MSKYIRGSKKALNAPQLPKYPPKNFSPIQAVVRGPISPAAVGLASMMLVTNATAQDAAQKPATSTATTSQTVTLPTISVRSTKRKPRARPAPVTPAAAPATPVVTAAPTGQTTYQAGQSSIGRMAVPLINTPQTVNVVTEKVLREQNTTSVVEALRNVSGITFRAGEGGNQGDSPYIRGFESRGDIFRDGIRDPGWYTRDSFAIDSVEVYKGPSSFMFGRGSTGGVVNVTTKTPTDRTFVETVATGSTAPGGRITLDANGKIDENVAARIQVMGQRYDVAGRDHVEENRAGVAPSVRVKLGDSTKVTFGYIYQHEHGVPDYGIPFLTPAWGIPRQVAPVPRNTWYGILGPNPDRTIVDAHTATAKIEHEFNSNVKVSNITRYQNVDRFQLNIFPEQAMVPPPPNLNVSTPGTRAQLAVNNSLWANQTDLVAKFATGFLQHTLVAGVDFSSEERNSLRNNYTVAAGGLPPAPTNFIFPDPYRFGGVPGNPGAGQILSAKGQNIGAYVADQVKLNQYFELLGGLRYDLFDYSQDSPPPTAAAGRHLERKDKLLSWRVGGIFHPIPDTSIYAMHGTSYNPSTEFLNVSTTSNPITLAPEQNTTDEVGFKAEVLNKKLTLAGAYFRIEKSNMRVADPSNGTNQVLGGTAEVKGFELSAQGNITPQWQIITSFTHLKSEITKTTIPAQLGKELNQAPHNSFSLWTTYDWTPQLQIGGGAFYVGQYWGDLSPTSTTATINTALVPAYWRFDAMAAYKINRYTTLQFNIYNIFDKYYFASAYTNWAVPGPSRYATLSLRVMFAPDPVKPTKTAGIFK